MNKFYFFKTGFILSLLFVLNSNAQTNVTYTVSTANIFNPDRGLYHQLSAHSNSYNLLSLSTLNNYRTSEKVSLILRMFDLEDFMSSPISATYLSNMAADFNTIRQAGLKAVVRFAYSNNQVTPYDANKATVLAQIHQIMPILQANQDIILCLQAGFIGVWGEWYYTSYFGDVGVWTATNLNDRREVIDSLFKTLPTNKTVSLRTPFYKTKILGITTNSVVNSSNAYNGTPIARLSHHNDCFLASSSDYGTYTDTTTQKPYLANDTKYTINGGETCDDNATFTNCVNAVKEMKRLHYTYMHRDYHPDVISRWQTEGCYNTIVNSLGYRLELQTGTFPSTALQNGNLAFSVVLKNTGYSGPVINKNINLVLRNISTSTNYSFPVSGYDIRDWLSGNTYTLNPTVTLNTLPFGNYKLFLQLTDPEASITNNPNYSIQFANVGTWEATTGFNDLLSTITITNTPAATPISTFTIPAQACVTSSLTITSNNTNGPTSYTWTASGANPATSNLQNASFTFTSTGTKTIALTSSNAAGNSAIYTQTITINANPTITAVSSSSAICYGASATLSVSGASSYTWSTGATTTTISVTPTITTSYSVLGKNTASCTNNKLISITVNASPTITAVASASAICLSASATLLAGGATSYTWSTGATTATISVTPTITTTYSVIGKNAAGCSSNKSLTVTVSANPTITAVASTSAICLGASATLSAGGATSYTWSTGATTASISVTPTTSTTYSVSGKNTQGCVSSKSVLITLNSNPLVGVVSTASILCMGQTAALTVSGASTYTWSSGSNSTSIVVSPSVTTTYSVIGANGNNCSSATTFIQMVSVCTGIDQLQAMETNGMNISIFPNPNNGTFNLKNVEIGEKIEIIDESNKVVYISNYNGKEIKLNHLVNGIYYIKIRATITKLMVNQ